MVTSAQLAVYKMACCSCSRCYIDVVYIQRHPFLYDYPHLASLYMPERGGTATPLLIDDLLIDDHLLLGESCLSQL